MTGSNARYDPLSTRDDDGYGDSSSNKSPSGPSPSYTDDKPAPNSSSTKASAATTTTKPSSVSHSLRPSVPPLGNDLGEHIAFYRDENDYLRQEYQKALDKIRELQDEEVARLKKDLESKGDTVFGLYLVGGISIVCLFMLLGGALIAALEKK